MGQVNLGSKVVHEVTTSWFVIMGECAKKIDYDAILQNGQLCRSEEDSGITLSSDVLWHAVAGPVPGIGAPQPRRATWVGASGDHTFIRIDENLIDARYAG